MSTTTSRSKGWRALVALPAMAAAALLAPGAAAPAAAQGSGSLTIIAYGEGSPGDKVSGACFDIYGIENGNPGMEVRQGVCMVNTNVLQLSNLPLPSSGTYWVEEYAAPTSIIGEDPVDTVEVQFGRAAAFAMSSGTLHELRHLRAGGVVVTATGPVSETADSALHTFTPCFEVTRQVPEQHMGRYCPGGPVLDLEPGSYSVRTLSRDGYLSATAIVGIESAVTDELDISVPLAPDYVVTLQDEQGTPLLGGCYDVLAVDVEGWPEGYRVASACDSYPVNDGVTTFVDLEPGTYTLHQWKAPSGYPLAPDREISAHAWLACAAGTCPPPNAVTLTVALPGQPPVAVADAVTTAEDTARTGNVLANDSDADGDALTASLTTPAGHGAVTVAPDGSFTYTPAADFFGTDTFGYAVTAGGDTADGVVTVSVTAVNDAPVASDDAASTGHATPVTLAVLGNDTDVEGDPLSVAVEAQPAGGTATVSGTSLVYTPNAGFSGTDTFSYAVSDGAATDVGTVTVTVAPAPLLPVPAAVAAVEAAIADLPAAAQPQPRRVLAQVGKHLDTGRAACAHARRLHDLAGSARFVTRVGSTDAARLLAAARTLRTALSCPA